MTALSDGEIAAFKSRSQSYSVGKADNTGFRQSCLF